MTQNLIYLLKFVKIPRSGNFKDSKWSILFIWCSGSWVIAAAAKSLQSCLTLCDPIDGSPPGSPIPGILQARTLEWVAISFSNAWKWKVKMKSLSHVRLLAIPRTAAHQAPPSMVFSRQKYWSGMPLPSLKYAQGDSTPGTHRGSEVYWCSGTNTYRVPQRSVNGTLETIRKKVPQV